MSSAGCSSSSRQRNLKLPAKGSFFVAFPRRASFNLHQIDGFKNSKKGPKCTVNQPTGSGLGRGYT